MMSNDNISLFKNMQPHTNYNNDDLIENPNAAEGNSPGNNNN
jgi:hypothetical protein